jgi:hypothetical protein
MARRKASDRLVDPEDFAPTQEEVDFETFLEEIGPGTSTIDIFRCNRDSTRSHEERVEFQALQADVFGYLRSNYGAGKFLLLFRDGARRFKGSKTITIGGGPGAQQQPQPQPLHSNGPAGDHLQFMREQMTMQQTLLTGLISAMKPPDLTPIANAMIAANKPQNPAEMLTAVTTVFTALKGPAKDEDWLDRAGKIITLAKGLSPSNSDGAEDNLYTVIKEVGRDWLAHQQGFAPGNGAAAITARQTAAVAPPQTTAALMEVNSTEVNEQNFAQWIRAGLVYLKDKAKRGKDIETVLDWMFENHEEPQFNALLGAVQRGATFEHLLQFDPEIVQNPALVEWFKALYDGIQAEIQNQKSVDSAGPGGNPDNATPHEGAGMAGSGATGNTGTS